ncbi:MAG: hypothetical protein NVSMB64_32710 [Candidatus Velthaea sp.]
MFRPFQLAAVGAAVFFLGAAPTGALYITTLPSGADVWVDGTYVGHAPVVLDALAAGRHAVSLTKNGWQPQDLDVNVVAGGTALSSVPLARVARAARGGGGFLAIRGLNVRDVTLDGDPVKPDKNGVYPAPSGSHELVARAASGRVTRTITVYPEMRTDVLLRDEGTTRSSVVAPALDYLPAEAVKIDGTHVAIKYEGRDVGGKFGSTTFRVDGRTTDFDAAPTLIGGRLYLPLELLTQLTAQSKR